MKLRPFFCYYGGKYRAAPHYPQPLYSHIVEPFAGAAGYATRYFDRDVTLYELNPKVFGVWDYLKRSSRRDILRLPLEITHVDELDVCQEAKWLIGFWLNKGTTSPMLSPSRWMRDKTRPNSFWGNIIRLRIASQVEHIRHWRIRNRSCFESPNYQATWFVDPPYQGQAGKSYPHKVESYKALAERCQDRRGQVIVCEQERADWLDFLPFRKIKSTEGSRGKGKSKEVIWTKLNQ